MRRARRRERERVEAVPDTVVVSTETATNTYREILASTPLAQREDIPSIAGRLLGRDENVPEGFEAAFEAFGLSDATSRLGAETTVWPFRLLRLQRGTVCIALDALRGTVCCLHAPNLVGGFLWPARAGSANRFYCPA